jgi:hypothetical protein
MPAVVGCGEGIVDALNGRAIAVVGLRAHSSGSSPPIEIVSIGRVTRINPCLTRRSRYHIVGYGWVVRRRC